MRNARHSRAKYCPIDALFLGALSDRDLEHSAFTLQRLAAWWLSEDAKARLRALPGCGELLGSERLEPGEFAALFERLSGSPNIADAFALPLTWVADRAHDARLPHGLRELAEAAVQSLRAATKDGAPREFGLVLGEHCPDLSNINLTCESAGAIVYATLRCVAAGFEYSQETTASAVVNPQGMSDVRGLVAKAAAAQRLGVRTIAIAHTQHRAEHSTMEAFKPIIGRTLDEQIAAIVGLLDAPPVNGEYDVRLQWYDRALKRHDSRMHWFYARCFVQDIALRARERTAPQPIDTLILVAGKRIEPILLATEILRPTRVIVLDEHDRPDSAFARCQADFNFMTGAPTLEFLRIPRELSSIAQLSAVLEPVLTLAERVGVDYTSGPKDAAFFLDGWARSRRSDHSCAKTYIRSASDGDRMTYGVREVVITFA